MVTATTWLGILVALGFPCLDRMHRCKVAHKAARAPRAPPKSSTRAKRPISAKRPVDKAGKLQPLAVASGDCRALTRQQATDTAHNEIIKCKLTLIDAGAATPKHATVGAADSERLPLGKPAG